MMARQGDDEGGGRIRVETTIMMIHDDDDGDGDNDRDNGDGDGDGDGDEEEEDDDDNDDDDDDVQQLTMRQGANSTTVMIEAGVNDDSEAVRCCGYEVQETLGRWDSKRIFIDLLLKSIFH